MKRIAIALCIAATATAAAASSLTIDAGTYGGNPPDINWWGQAFYLNDQGEPGVGVGMSGNLSLFDSFGGTVDNIVWTVMGGSWQGQYVSSLSWGTCYSDAINAQTFDQFGQKYSGSTCNPVPPAPPGGGNPGNDLVVGSGANDPLVVNLENGPYRLAGLNDAVSFDIDASGQRKTIAWTARDTAVAFLALDRNGDGVIGDGSELFGNATPLSAGGRAANGFVALAQYDTNGDGVIDAADAVWPTLLLWTDRNHDGISQPEELQAIASSPITRISLEHHWMGKRDASGNLFGYQAIAATGNSVRPMYDVFFRSK